jgi:hypothetical protein
LKVLIFDIDGVVNSERSCAAFDGYPHDFSPRDMARFDHVALALVRRLCDSTDCSIVVSSTWRTTFTLHEIGCKLELPVMAATPDLGGEFSRADEIAAWLKAHPEVTHYAIVDDLPLYFEDIEHQARFVQTNEEFGLSLADYRQLRRLLLPGTPP